ncbi:MAG: class I SAM-dependent methyltransferase [Gammaproteobacteria bacterium]
MTSKLAKEILAFVRKGDFAHPGEIEAIEMALQPINKKKSQLILDVGCGLGGTANYVQQQGWGLVTGLDLDAELIQYANLRYPELSFILDDILKAQTSIQEKFDLIYSFSAFFCFTEQKQALKQMACLAKPQAELVIFDYSRFISQDYISPFPWSNTASCFNPIYLPEFEQWLLESGWHLTSTLDISEHFENWYTQLLQLFTTKRAEILRQFDTNLLDKMIFGYQQLLMDIKSHKIGGIIVYADKA